ncbi:MAG: DUF3300 domain-containing protein [Proteobacteria bacterium]|nr:DUF3300 domain-containing protein [Pseudomonadota bacterium]
MRNLLITTVLVSALSTYSLVPLLAQTTAASGETATTGAAQSEEAEFAGLTAEELDALVAPVALYPDTLLIQVLVAATYPLDIIKAQRFLNNNDGLEQDALTDAVEAQPWDPSVQVLATAFPTVLNRMADNIDWTEMAGNAMLAQPDDVMISVQRMREAAIDAGSLIDTAEQEVMRDETEAVVIVPTNPEIVYVPTYRTQRVYYQNNDALIFFSTAILIGTIYHRHHHRHWHGYWGCRNCGGYNGRPTHYRSGGININGNVNIGNNVGNNWKPQPHRETRAKENLRTRASVGDRNRPGASTGKVPSMNNKATRGDAMRKDLGRKTGAKDISRPANRPTTGKAGTLNRPNAGAQPTNRPSTGKADTLNRPTRTRPANNGAAKRPATPKRNIAPNNSRTRPATRPTANPQVRQPRSQPSTFQRNQSGGGARRSSSRGGGKQMQGGRRR